MAFVLNLQAREVPADKADVARPLSPSTTSTSFCISDWSLIFC